MLPTHRSRRPLPAQSSVSGSLFQTTILFFSRPSYRWLLYCLAFATSLWFLAPYLLHLDGHRPPPGHGHGHMTRPNDGGRHPPMPGMFPHPPVYIPPPPPYKGPSTIWSTRADQVKDAYLHAWSGYQRLAAPADELLPVSGGKVDK